MPPDDVIEGRRWAKRYHSLGFNPLPSRTDAKRPWLTEYAALRDEGVSQFILERWWSPNIQIATGSKWDLVVIDCDGPKGMAVWDGWCRRRDYKPNTWVVESYNADGSVRGRHVWYRNASRVSPDSPDDRGEPCMQDGGASEGCPASAVGGQGGLDCRSRILWAIWNDDGSPAKGDKVELKGDGALIVAPPSIHTKTGQPYRFVNGGPDSDVAIEPLPAWVHGQGNRIRKKWESRPKRAVNRIFVERREVSWDDKDSVLDAIDPISVASDWGLRLAGGRANSAGWVRFYRDDDDRNPSASVHRTTGQYWDNRIGQAISLFDLGVKLGVYETAYDCLCDLHRIAMKESGHAMRDEA